MLTRNESHTGTFTLDNGLVVFGTIRLCGKNTQVSFFSDADLHVGLIPKYITGELYDGRLVTLLDCVVVSTGSNSLDSERRQFFAQLFPHFVAIGTQHIPFSTPSIQHISFVMRNASSVFYDFDAFSGVINPAPFVELLKRDIAHIRPVDIGDDPIIGYFTGKFDIAVIEETPLGKIKAHHQPTETMSGPNGWGLRNEIMVTLIPDQVLTFDQGLNRLNIMLRFFEFVIGCEQPLAKLGFGLQGQREFEHVDIYRSFAIELSEVDSNEEKSTVGPCDVLVTVAESSEQYETIFKNYLELDGERRDGRERFRTGFNKGRNYTIDRLVAAANLFDIFPKSSYPRKAIISKEIADAKDAARDLFIGLPKSNEREKFLSAVGRIDEFSLKHKARYRATSTGLDKHFPNILEVLDESVNCRNHYVHGSPGKIDYSSNFGIVAFFVATLEFVFGASDLIDSGWNFSAWKNNTPQQEHPFGAFIIGYAYNLDIFKKLITESK